MSPAESGSNEFSVRRSPRLAGMSNPEIGSSQSALRRSPRLIGKFALRRSPRLIAKSAMSMPKRSQIAPRKRPAKGKSAISTRKSPAKGKSAITMPKRSQISPRKSLPKGKSAMIKPKSPRKSLPGGCGMTFNDWISFAGIDTFMRSNRECEAQHFKEMYTSSTDCHVKKTCIHPGGVFTWEDNNASGISWVAFRGRSTTCVVFKRNLEHVKDRTRSYLRYNGQGITFNFIGSSIISEIEVLADLPNGSNQRFGYSGNVHKPFAIVYVDPSTTNDHVENDNEKAAIKYLEGIIEKDKVFYRHEAEEAAICAFQLLCNQKFEPDDLWVAVAFLGEEVNLSSFDISLHLASINGKTDENKDRVGPSITTT